METKNCQVLIQGVAFPYPLSSRKKKRKEKEELRRCNCLGDRELDDLDEGAHAKTTKQAESYTEI